MITDKFTRKDVIVPGLEKEYRILHITDSHIVVCTEEEGEFIIQGDGYWAGTKLYDFYKLRHEAFKVDGVTTAELFEQMCDELAANPDCADVIVFTGDIMDFFSQSGFDFVKRNGTGLFKKHVYAFGKSLDRHGSMEIMGSAYMY